MYNSFMLPAKKQDSSPNLGLMGEHHEAEAWIMPVKMVINNGAA